MRPADSDGAGWRTRLRRAKSDLAFLEALRNATVEELVAIEANHAHKSAPEWRKVAIARAKARLGLR